MRRIPLAGLSLCVAVVCYLTVSDRHVVEAGGKADGQVAHMVYFTLKDNSPAEQQKLVDACHKYLTKHTGEVFFRAGSRGIEFKRSVNDLDFDVSLLIVFQDKAGHDAYEAAPRHKQFIEENKGNWKKVRVFDSLVSK